MPRFLTPIVAALISFLPTLVHADGMMAARIQTGTATDLVSSPKQEAILSHDGQTVTVVLRTHFAHGPQDLAWIVPVPAEPTDIAIASDALFASLAELTTPHFTYFEPRSQFAFGCGVQEAREVRPVIVENTGTAGIYQYAVLSARQPTDLTDWLSSNGYRVPPHSAATFALYTARHFHFLAMKLRPDLARSAATLAPHPIGYRYRSGSLTFPLIVSRLSAAPENEIILYVLGPSRYAAGNFANASINEPPFINLTYDAVSPSRSTYESIFRHAARLDPHLFVTEYARDAANLRIANSAPTAYTAPARATASPVATGPTPPIFLTRLRALLTPDSMDRDLELIPIRPLPVGHSAAFAAPERAGLLPTLLPLTPACLALLLLRRHRTRTPWAVAALLVIPAITLVSL